MQLDLPSNPTLNQIYQQGGAIYQWTGVKWKRLNTRITTAVTEYVNVVEQNESNISIEPNKYNYYKIDFDSDLYVNIPTSTPYSSIIMQLNRKVTDDNYNICGNVSEIELTSNNPHTSIDIRPDGKIAYILDDANNRLYAYQLESPFDISKIHDMDITYTFSEDNDAASVRFSQDGSRMYMLGRSNDNVYEYVLSNPWDISTISYNNVSVSTLESTPQSMYFSPDGKWFYIIGTSNDIVYQFSMDVPWSLGTATVIRSRGVSAQTSSPYSIMFSNDGTKMFVSQLTRIYYYELSEPWDISTATFVTDYLLDNISSTDGYQIFSSDGLKIFKINNSSGNYRIYSQSLATPFDLSTIILPSYDNISFSVTGQFTNPYGVSFSSDGTNMYSSKYDTTGTVYHYKLLTAWDVSTATFYKTLNLTITYGLTHPPTFSPDGSKMYIVDSAYATTFGIVSEYELSVPWEIVTANFVSSFSQSYAKCIKFKPDGSACYVLYDRSSATTTQIYQYSLSTPWSISTATYEGLGSLVVATTHYSFDFNSDGTKLYTLRSDDRIYEYRLRTPWDVKSSSILNELLVNVSVNAQDNTMTGIYFKPDGTKMYTTGINGDSIYQYSIGSYISPNIRWSDNIEWDSGIVPTYDFDNTTTILIQFITYDGETWIGSPITTSLRSNE